MSVRIVPASEVGDVARLQGLAERVFGRRRRAPGWFTRKLRRECVRPELSVVAVRDGASPDDPAAWCGYVLVGAPPSLAGVARTAGTGVVPGARGTGVGRRLVEAACERAADAGLHTVRILAAPEAAAFYTRLGFRREREVSTLLAFARGPSAWLAGAAEPWTPVDVEPGHTHVELVGWFREAWEETPADHRVSVPVPNERGDVTWIHLSAEGSAWLIHRVLAPVETATIAVADGLLERLPDGTPVLSTGVAPDCDAARELLDLGWVEVQRGQIVARSQ